MALGKPIVPVLSQDFQPPADLHPVLVQAIEHTGVSMDTQFHTAAFDHLSQLVGGRKRSEQRRRVTVFGSLAFLVLVGLLGIGAREILGLSAEFHREREARQAAIARSEELEKNLTVLEANRAESMRAAQDTERRVKDEVDRRERQARSEAENREREAKDQAERRRYACNNRCESTLRDCESTCFYKLDGAPREACKQSCKQYEPFCKSNCQ